MLASKRSFDDRTAIIKHLQRRLLCQEETEQDRLDPGQELEWAVAAVARDRDAWEGIELVLDHQGIASAQSVASACLIEWERRATK